MQQPAPSRLPALTLPEGLVQQEVGMPMRSDAPLAPLPEAPWQAPLAPLPEAPWQAPLAPLPEASSQAAPLPTLALPEGLIQQQAGIPLFTQAQQEALYTMPEACEPFNTADEEHAMAGILEGVPLQSEIVPVQGMSAEAFGLSVTLDSMAHASLLAMPREETHVPSAGTLQQQAAPSSLMPDSQELCTAELHSLASQLQSMPPDANVAHVLPLLQAIEAMPLSVEDLRATRLGVITQAFKDSPDPQVKACARRLRSGWKDMLRTDTSSMLQ
eukprot:3661365-Amphidinium_carterae.1